jgi:hypothetical protein
MSHFESGYVKSSLQILYFIYFKVMLLDSYKLRIGISQGWGIGPW